MKATKFDVHDSLTRISLALGRPVDWLADSLAVYVEAVERHGLSVEALQAAALDIADTWTEPRFPPVGVVLARAREWMGAHRVDPQVRSPLCPLCPATAGEVEGGRLATRHTPDCPHYDATVRPFTARERTADWRTFLTTGERP